MIRRWVGRGIGIAMSAAMFAALLPGTPAAARAAEWLDPGYGTAGRTVLPGEGDGFPGMSRVDALDRVYVYGFDGQQNEGRMHRLLADGTVDPSFGGGSVAVPGSRRPSTRTRPAR